MQQVPSSLAHPRPHLLYDMLRMLMKSAERSSTSASKVLCVCEVCVRCLCECVCMCVRVRVKEGGGIQ